MGRIRRRWPWIASGLLHAGLLALLALLARPPARGEVEAAIGIEVTDSPAAEATTPAAPEPREVAAEPLAAASEAAGPPARARVRRALPPAPAPTPDPAGGGSLGEAAEAGLGLGWELGALGGAGGGGGGGLGDAGRGLGGAGMGRGALRAVPVRAAVRRVSKARPPRLVYPKRFRDEREGAVFVALLTVDEDGWVVGVRLVKGVDPFADEKALTAVWRFHYEPALDDAGRPVRAKVEQRFMVD